MQQSKFQYRVTLYCSRCDRVFFGLTHGEPSLPVAVKNGRGIHRFVTCLQCINRIQDSMRERGFPLV